MRIDPRQRLVACIPNHATVAALLLLAAVGGACGDTTTSTDAGGTGGSGGTGGTGGTGGVTEPPPDTACEQMCGHVYDDCDLAFAARNGERLPYENCVEACGAGAFEEEETTCLTTMECTLLAMSACVGGPSEPSAECEAMCTHVYDCGYKFQGDDGITTREECPGKCTATMPAQLVSCLTAIECSLEALHACIGVPPPSDDCRAFCSKRIHDCDQLGDPTTDEEYVCALECTEDRTPEEIACVLAAACADVDTCLGN